MRVRVLVFGELSHHLGRSLSLKLEEVKAESLFTLRGKA